MLPKGYNVRKAAQLAAFFTYMEGGTINVLKLVKLIYLADRAFLEKYDSPILFDRLVSMDHGPVNSTTLDFINGLSDDSQLWDSFISDKANHTVGLSKPSTTLEDLDELSTVELEVLDEVWKNFGHMNQYQIRDYTHQACPEWEDPSGSSKPIPYERIFKHLGKQNAALLSQAIDEDRQLSSAWDC